MDSYFERTENGITAQISLKEGLAEVNHAMMDGRRQVRTMSSGRTRHAIEYKDGRKVTLALVDTPVTEPEEWGSAATSLILHKFRGEGSTVRAACNSSIRWHPRPLSRTEGPRLQTRAELEAGEYAHLRPFCTRCEKR
ncbi:hypothetical protein [Streptomyces sp. NPDC020141]|uniref:hypothetical protein n=1 Tax=Streptomyces sp. NPDC020141 TaxID=3365065 RepID=UPI00379905DC